jgi:hypothetical protein
MVVRNTNVLSHLIRISEQGLALSASVLQAELVFKDQDNGKTLSFSAGISNEQPRRLRYRGTRLIDDRQTVASVYSGEDSTWEVKLYVVSTGKSYGICVNYSDFKVFFPGFVHFVEQTAGSAVHTDMDLETLFYLPLIDKLTLLRTPLGLILVWKLGTEETAVKSQGLSAVSDRAQVLRQQTVQEAAVNKPGGGMLAHTEEEFQVLLQRGRTVCGEQALLTVVQHSFIQEWRLILYFFASGRQFVVRLYDSDLFSLSEDALSTHYGHSRHVVNSAHETLSAWELIVHECQFERTEEEMRFVFDSIVAPVREVLCMQYLTDSLQHTHYAEASIKETLPIDFTGLKSIEEAASISLILRAYSFEKRVWVKETMSLTEAFRVLIREQTLDEQVLLKRRLNYSELRHIAGQLIRVVRLSNRVKHINRQQQHLPQFSELSDSGKLDPFVVNQEWQQRELHSLTSIYEHDRLLYQEAVPPIVAAIFFNEMLDEFIYVVYRPADGSLLRRHLSPQAVRKLVPYCEALLTESLHALLGRRILFAFLDMVQDTISE